MSSTVTNAYDDAISVARTSSKTQPRIVCVYQTGAAEFAIAYEGDAVDAPSGRRGVLCAQFKNGFSVADPRSKSRAA
jgi:hypothetical protein